MKVTNDVQQRIIKFCGQVDTLLFQSLESTSQSASQSLIEMAMEKNKEIENFLLELGPLTNRAATQNSFAARLRLALAHSGMTQAALAWGIGVSQSTISALVTGKSKEAGIVRARAIAEALEVDAQWLLYGEGEMQPAKFLTHNDEV
ncbi:helix-turn-helix domain-containing protein [Providencia rettgeri]